MDGHDSHWHCPSIQLLRDNHCYLLFLKSPDSTNDQPNDMGNNGQMQCQYKYAVNDWMARYAGLADLLNAYFWQQRGVLFWRTRALLT
jgi:hypothetical protein